MRRIAHPGHVVLRLLALVAAAGAPATVFSQGFSSAVGGNSERLPPPVSLAGSGQTAPAADPNLIGRVDWSPWTASQVTIPQRFYAGAELLLVRPHLSEPIAFFAGDNLGGTATGKMYLFEFNYQASPRVFLGYRNPATGNAVQFTYWHYQGSERLSFDSESADEGFVPNAWLPGAEFVAEGGLGAEIHEELWLRLDLFDIELFTPFVFDDGRWLVTASAGARIADFSQRWDILLIDDSAEVVFDQTLSLGFVGAGPRVGLAARRNIGTRGALYLKGGYAILLGERFGHVESTPLDEGAPGFSLDENLTRMVTVTDIELGGSWRAWDHVILSAGYMFQAWTDLSGLTSNLNFTSNSNLLTFDGFVARCAVQF